MAWACLGFIITFGNNTFFCWTFYSKLRIISQNLEKLPDNSPSSGSNSPSKVNDSTQSQKMLQIAKKNTLLTLISITSSFLMVIFVILDPTPDQFFAWKRFSIFYLGTKIILSELSYFFETMTTVGMQLSDLEHFKL